MPIGEETKQRIVAAVSELVSEKVRAVKLEVQLVGDDVKREIELLREQADREREGDPTPVPSGMMDRSRFWQHLLGLLAAVGMHFDDLYSYVIKRGEKRHIDRKK